MMKNFLRISSAITLMMLAALFFILKEENNPVYKPYTPEVKTKKEKIAEEHGDAAKYIHEMRKNPYTGIVSMTDVSEAIGQANRGPRAKKELGLSWESVGPDNVGGRTRAIVVDKDNSNIVYAGGVSGGFWKSTNRGSYWQQKVYSGDYTNLNIVSMDQSSDGTIYFGTGEMGFTRGSNGVGESGNMGMGMWKSTDKGETWTQIPSTIPAVKFSLSGVWKNVHDLVVDPANPKKIYACNDGGIYISTDGGDNWDKAQGVLPAPVLDIKISGDGKTIFAGAYGILYRSLDGGNSFERLTSSNNPGFPTFDIGRIEVDIAPSDPNYVYIAVAKSSNFKMNGVYQSMDKGNNWKQILNNSSAFDPFSHGAGTDAGQGDYDNVIAVDPFNPSKLYLGGINFYIWDNNNWYQAANSSEFVGNTRYMHVDYHEIHFDTKTNPPGMYIGSDGGIFYSKDFTTKKYPTYSELNLGYITTQFYAIAASSNGDIIGGTQDNNTLRIEKGGFTGKSATQINSGDGFHCDISELNPEAYIFESQYGGIRRSSDKGDNSSQFFDDNIPAGGDRTAWPFNTPFQLWETKNDTLSRDSITYGADSSVQVKKGKEITNPLLAGDSNFVSLGGGRYRALRDIRYLPGDSIEVRSNNGVLFWYTFEHSVLPLQKIRIQDKIQTIFVASTIRNVWLTKDAINFSKAPVWFQITGNIGGFSTSRALDISPDGNTVLLGKGSGLYRITGLRNALYKYDEKGNFYPDSVGIETKLIFTATSGATITGVNFDDNDPNRAVVTVGNYGISSHVAYTQNALEPVNNPNFNYLDEVGATKLPDMPCYDALFNKDKPNQIIVATELGIFSYDLNNASAGWSEENTGMDRVPTHMIRQKKLKPWHQGPTLFIGTHGRGIFKSSTLNPNAGIDDRNENKRTTTLVNIYPNPAHSYLNVEVTTAPGKNVVVDMIDLHGKVVSSSTLSGFGEGNKIHRINTSNIPNGTYLVRVTRDGESKIGKVLISR